MASRHYGPATAESGDYDEAATAVVALLNKRGRKRAKRVTSATEGAGKVRYHVDVDET